MFNHVDEAIRQANASSVTLLFTDIALAQTMLDRAELSRDGETRERNLNHATKACESVHHFMRRLRLTDDETCSLTEKIEALRARLRTLRPLPDG